MVSIYELPHEILLLIINELETERDISVFTQLNRFFYRCFTPYLYQHNVGQSKSSALVYAARYGRLLTATKAIELGGADPDLIASNQTVLSHAAKAGHAEICEFLLSRYNVKVDSRHIRNNFTPLLIAASFGHAPVVRVLLAHGANPNETEGGRDRSGRSALSLACVRGFPAVVDVLLADAPALKVDGYSTNTDHIPLLAAIRFRHESIALKLLDRGADPCISLRQRIPPNTSAVAKFSAQTLGSVIKGSQLRVLERLLMWEGPQPNLLDPNAVWGDNTPLLTAVWNNCDEAVKILLDDPRVDVNFIIPKEQMTALMQAELQEYRSIADLLLAYGADPDLPDCTGMTPRMIREIPREQWRAKRNEYYKRLSEVREARRQAEESTFGDRIEAIRARMRARRAARAAEQQNPSSQVE
ncbi:ankyrin repeat-containing domain protein [Aspergillus parasiticus]|uniref:Ankyrin repeat-containing domain protein n=1 Tax=Aspergillus parasiticus TaxID=5067 RepID=A0A5N6DMK5_ASPPA|nr:ankyrin repeat-containing domain protein [Aspergillus parasiticus]